MIPPIPPSFGFSLLAIPVWQWEEQPAPTTDATSRPTADGGTCEGDAGEGNAATSLEKRLVFVGYEWRPSIQWSLFPDAPGEHGFDDQTSEIREGTLRYEREQQQFQQTPHAKLQGTEAGAKPHGAPVDPPNRATTPASPSETSTD